MCCSFKIRTNCAYERNLFVYAKSISDTAEKSRVGVVSVNSSILVFFMSC